MNSVFDIINVPLGYLFKGIYALVQNYGLTIVIFTLIVKFIMFPLTLKQQKSMKKTQALQPKLQALQEKYQYDKEKLSQETMKLYQESGVNPMGGCLPLLIQFPILIALYNIIRKPLSYIMMMSNDRVMEIYKTLTGKAADSFSRIDQLGLAKMMEEGAEKLGDIASEIINFDFFGFDLSVTPSFQFISQHPLYILIPVLAGGTTFLVSHISSKMAGTQNANSQANSSMQTMNVIFPFMTAWFSITLPAGLGLYWTVSNLFQLAQTVIMNRFITVDVPEFDNGPKHFRERKKKKK